MRRSLALLLTLALAATAAHAGTLAGVDLPDSATAGEQALTLNGMALRSKAIFKVYVAGLYLPAEQSDAQQVLAADTTRRLVMHWVRSVGKEKICDAWTEGLEANNPTAPAAVVQDFEKLCSYMEDARSGDQFVFTYEPEKGTTVEVKGTKKGTIAGKAFADALFACWIGPHPGPGEDFRTDLMGG